MIAASVADTGKEETQEVIPKIIQVIHAASIKLVLKIIKYYEVTARRTLTIFREQHYC
jgi:hypothetical protein